jgi:hypothetical protein
MYNTPPTASTGLQGEGPSAQPRVIGMNLQVNADKEAHEGAHC